MYYTFRSDGYNQGENGMEVIWSDLAIHDLQNIAEYISDNFGDKISVSLCYLWDNLGKSFGGYEEKAYL